MIAAILIALVRVYQLTLSKILLYTVGPVCRFEPSCSRYAVACLRDHGALRGSLLSVKRLCRCHPFHPGGYDPPPPAPPKGALRRDVLQSSPREVRQSSPNDTQPSSPTDLESATPDPMSRPGSGAVLHGRTGADQPTPST